MYSIPCIRREEGIANRSPTNRNLILRHTWRMIATLSDISDTVELFKDKKQYSLIFNRGKFKAPEELIKIYLSVNWNEV